MEATPESDDGWTGLGFPPAEGPPVSSPAPAASAEKVKVSGPSQSTELVQLASRKYRVVRGDESRIYAVDKSHPSVAVELSKDGIGNQLAADYYDETGRASTGSARMDALAVLSARARAQDVELVHLRVGRHNGGVVIDLGTDTGAVVAVSSEGWQIVKRSPVLFRRNGLGLPFPDPIRGGATDGLRGVLNVEDAAFRQLIGWLVAAFMPDLPQPILVLTGQQGTAKTTAAKMVLSLIDPSEAEVQSQPSTEENWAVQARSVYGVGLDNISRMPAWFQDALCKAVTGGSLVRRARYSDSEPSTIKLLRPVVLTTINPGALQGDVADRMLKIELQPVPPSRRRKSAEVAAAFAASHASIFGALLDLLVKVLAALPKINLAESPRMADFAAVLAALDHVTGWSTLSDYLAGIEDLAHDVIDGDSFATALMQLVNDSGRWRGTCAELIPALDDGRFHNDWPKNPRGTAEKLTRLAPALARSGVAVEREGHTRRGTIYSITRTGLDGDLCEVCQTPLAAALASQGETTHPNCAPREELQL